MDKFEINFYLNNIIQDEKEQNDLVQNSLDYISLFIDREAAVKIRRLREAKEEPEMQDDSFEETLKDLDALDEIKVYPIKDSDGHSG